MPSEPTGTSHPVRRVTPSPEARSKMGDIARAYIAVAIGYVLGYAIGYVVERGTNVLYVVHLMWFVGSLVFLPVALGYRAPDEHVFAARLIGAFAGWRTFIFLFHYPQSVWNIGHLSQLGAHRPSSSRDCCLRGHW